VSFTSNVVANCNGNTDLPRWRAAYSADRSNQVPLSNSPLVSATTQFGPGHSAGFARRQCQCLQGVSSKNLQEWRQCQCLQGVSSKNLQGVFMKGGPRRSEIAIGRDSGCCQRRSEAPQRRQYGRRRAGQNGSRGEEAWIPVGGTRWAGPIPGLSARSCARRYAGGQSPSCRGGVARQGRREGPQGEELRQFAGAVTQPLGGRAVGVDKGAVLDAEFEFRLFV